MVFISVLVKMQTVGSNLLSALPSYQIWMCWQLKCLCPCHVEIMMLPFTILPHSLTVTIKNNDLLQCCKCSHDRSRKWNINLLAKISGYSNLVFLQKNFFKRIQSSASETHSISFCNLHSKLAFLALNMFDWPYFWGK